MIKLWPEQLFDGERLLTNHAIWLEGQRIAAIKPACGDEIKLKGLLTAGFIDCQVNGGDGVLLNDQPTSETIARMLACHARYGTTSMLPTLITDSFDKMQQAAKAVQQQWLCNPAAIVGIHFEGPHLSVAKKGCLLYTSPSPRDMRRSRMPSSA